MDLKSTLPMVAPACAATVVLLRDSARGVEVFCLERHGKASFLAGALVFPGGALEVADAESDWPVHPRLAEIARGQALAVCALRETLEEAGVLLGSETHAHADLSPEVLSTLRHEVNHGAKLAELLAFLEIPSPDLRGLVPFARWITPSTEAKRFDTLFFLAKAPSAQEASCDGQETVSGLWATPRQLLDRWQRKELRLVPPTHATLDWLLAYETVAEAEQAALELSLEPICPELISTPTTALVLPGDPQHSVPRARHPYSLRYVAQDERFVPTFARRRNWYAVTLLVEAAGPAPQRRESVRVVLANSSKEARAQAMAYAREAQQPVLGGPTWLPLEVLAVQDLDRPELESGAEVLSAPVPR